MAQRRSHSSNISVALFRAIAHHFNQSARALPAAAWGIWGKTLLAGLGVSALITYGIVRLAMFWQSRGLQAWDERVLPGVADALPFSFAKAITLESPGNMIYLIPLVLALVGLAAWRSRPLIASSIAVSYLLQYALVWIGWGLWNRDRPDVIASGLAAPGLHAFPSGHATVITAVFGFLAYLWIRASRSRVERVGAIALFLGWTFITSSARLVLGAHWVSDVVAGWIVGFLWLLVVIVAFERAQAVCRSGKGRHSATPRAGVR
ncbi:MAG: phosphatase PAP2 family protein [Synechococcales bacterium]|nr:phosphatase PAP2 family protein [Synechococcales bacterium]